MLTLDEIFFCMSSHQTFARLSRCKFKAIGNRKCFSGKDSERQPCIACCVFHWEGCCLYVGFFFPHGVSSPRYSAAKGKGPEGKGTQAGPPSKAPPPASATGDPWANGNDPWASAAGKGPSKGVPAQTSSEGSRDPWAGGNDPWASAAGKGPGKGVPAQTSSEGSGDPWANGNDPWASAAGKGPGKGIPAQAYPQGPSKGAPVNLSRDGKGAHDPWENGNDPWSSGSSEKGKGKGKPPAPPNRLFQSSLNGVRPGPVGVRPPPPQPGPVGSRPPQPSPVGVRPPSVNGVRPPPAVGPSGIDPWQEQGDPWQKNSPNAPAACQPGNEGKGGKAATKSSDPIDLGKQNPSASDPWLHQDPWSAGSLKALSHT